MLKVLFVIHDLNYHGAARQLTLLAQGLPSDQVEPHVCVLGSDGPFGQPLRAAGVPVEILGWTRLLDPQPFWRLRRLVSALQPDVIHTWQPAALRLAGLAALHQGGRRRDVRRPPRLVASYPFGLPQLEDRLAWLDRWLLRRADRVVVSGPADADRCRQRGLPEGQVERIPPGVDMDRSGSGWAAAGSAPSSPWPLAGLASLPEGARVLAGVGPFEPPKGFRDVVWAFDILRFLYDDLHLVLVGDGPDRERLERFVRNIQATDRVHLLGCQPDVRPLLDLAHVVVVPGRECGGVNAALEAMAAGRAVVAARLPDLAEVVADGESGLLAAPADPVALARQIRVVLEDGALRERFGEAGRRRAASRFAAPEMVQRYTRLYAALGVEPQRAQEEAVPGMVP